jgi:hypothetical protein
MVSYLRRVRMRREIVEAVISGRRIFGVSVPTVSRIVASHVQRVRIRAARRRRSR